MTEAKTSIPFNVASFIGEPVEPRHTLDIGDIRATVHAALTGHGIGRTEAARLLSLVERKKKENARLVVIKRYNKEHPENYSGNCLLLFGSMLSCFIANEEFIKTVEGYGVAQVFKRKTDEDSHTIEALIGGTKHGISGADFLDTKKLLEEHKTSDLYMYLSDALKNTPDEIKGPASFCQSIITAYAQRDVPPLVPPGIYTKDINELLKKVKASTNAVIERFREAFFDPNHPEHDDVVGAVSRQLIDPEKMLVPIIFIVKDLVEDYRNIVRYIDENGEDEVFLGLRTIEEWYISRTSRERLNFPEELEEYQIGQLPPETGVDYESINSLTNQIFSCSSKENFYVADLVSEDWNVLEMPDYLGIYFRKNNSTEVTVGIMYGELDRSRGMSVSFDLKAKKTDWSLFDAPEKNPDLLAQMSRVAILSLTHLRDKLKEEWEEKRRQRNAVLVRPGSKKAVQRSVHVPQHERSTTYTQTTDDEKKQSFIARMVGAISEEPPSEAQGVVKRAISVPEGKALERVLKGFSAEDRQLILAELSEFNEREGNVGRRFYQLQKPKQRGEKVYSLKVTLADLRWARVTLDEGDETSGQNMLQIREINHRGSAFRNL